MSHTSGCLVWFFSSQVTALFLLNGAVEWSHSSAHWPFVIAVRSSLSTEVKWIIAEWSTDREKTGFCVLPLWNTVSFSIVEAVRAEPPLLRTHPGLCYPLSCKWNQSHHAAWIMQMAGDNMAHESMGTWMLRKWLWVTCHGMWLSHRVHLNKQVTQRMTCLLMCAWMLMDWDIAPTLIHLINTTPHYSNGLLGHHRTGGQVGSVSERLFNYVTA